MYCAGSWHSSPLKPDDDRLKGDIANRRRHLAEAGAVPKAKHVDGYLTARNYAMKSVTQFLFPGSRSMDGKLRPAGIDAGTDTGNTGKIAKHGNSGFAWSGWQAGGAYAAWPGAHLHWVIGAPYWRFGLRPVFRHRWNDWVIPGAEPLRFPAALLYRVIDGKGACNGIPCALNDGQ